MHFVIASLNTYLEELIMRIKEKISASGLDVEHNTEFC